MNLKNNQQKKKNDDEELQSHKSLFGTKFLLEVWGKATLFLSQVLLMVTI